MMTKLKTIDILIVDDEAAIRDMVRMALELEGFQVHDASTAHAAKLILDREQIDLILLDWMMPGISGIEFAASVRRGSHKDIGIIMLTAKDTEEDLIRGLEMGADDYVRKPFSTKELISRINALVRRATIKESPEDVLNIGKFSINTGEHQVYIDSELVDFSPTEYRLLYFLMRNAGRAYQRDQLLDNVWGNQVYVEDRTVDVHIRRLRKILEGYDCDGYIQTVRGVGYRFAEPKKR